MGGSQTATRQHSPLHGKISLREHLVSVRQPHRNRQRSREAFRERGDCKPDPAVHGCPSPQHAILPQGNGLVESTNRTLKGILRKIIYSNRTDWDRKLQSALWAYRTSFKTSIGSTPFRLAFGLEAVMPIEFKIPTVRIQVQEWLPEHASRLLRMEQLLTLDEELLESECHLERDQVR